MKNPITFFLFLVFAFVNLVDIVTAFFISPGESNPIYLLFGNFYALIALKCFFVFIAYYYIKRNIYPSTFMYYIVVLILVLGSLLISLGAYSNIYGILNPSVIEEGAKMSVGEKVKGYTLFVSIIYFIPAIFNLLTFFLYDKSVGKAKIDKEYFKKIPWWHL